MGTASINLPKHEIRTGFSAPFYLLLLPLYPHKATICVILLRGFFDSLRSKRDFWPLNIARICDSLSPMQKLSLHCGHWAPEADLDTSCVSFLSQTHLWFLVLCALTCSDWLYLLSMSRCPCYVSFVLFSSPKVCMKKKKKKKALAYYLDWPSQTLTSPYVLINGLPHKWIKWFSAKYKYFDNQWKIQIIVDNLWMHAANMQTHFLLCDKKLLLHIVKVILLQRTGFLDLIFNDGLCLQWTSITDFLRQRLI